MNYYDFALKNFNSAMALYSYSDEYDNTVVHCQQYLEKALKYLIIIRYKELSKGSKLITLARKLNIEELNVYDDFFRQVQDYYFDKRYPGEDYIETTKEECDYVVNKTIELKSILEKLINGSDADNKIRDMCKIEFKDILEYNGELENLSFGFRNFLDIFYNSSDKQKEELVKNEPSDKALDINRKDKIVFIAGLHFLCEWFWLDTPMWMLKRKYVLDEAYYPGATTPELIKWAKHLSKKETIFHNVYIDISSLVMRI